MKVIAFNGSPHERGTTWRGIATVAEELEKAGVETEIVHAGKGPVQGCTGCGSCFGKGTCRFDDIVNESKAKLESAQGLLLASPVYYGGIAGTFKSFLDRLFFIRPDLRFKPGAGIVALRRSGGISAFQQLNNYLNLAQVLIVPSQYWGVYHGANADQALSDGEGMSILRTLGRNMAWLLKTASASPESPPEPAERIMTNFIR
jgi:multimeric flavodoxin WrbA